MHRPAARQGGVRTGMSSSRKYQDGVRAARGPWTAHSVYDGAMNASAQPEFGWWPAATTLGLVAAASLLGIVAGRHLAPPDVVMLYVLAIVASAMRLGRSATLMASGLSVLAYDFFFVEPLRTFAVNDERYLLTFVTMFVVGLLVSGTSLRLRRHEREAVDREQRASSAELKARTEEMRSTLLSAVSHDLRTPLGAITGAATTLRDGGGEVSDSQRIDLLETICEEAERLERFVANLLDMTRLQSGAFDVKREWVPLEEIVGSAATRLERQLQGRALRITLSPDLPLVFVDPVLMGQVIFNLLENGTKHTSPGTALSVTGGIGSEGIVVEVSDDGAGLHSGDEARVFDKFFRHTPHGVPGAGLGSRSAAPSSRRTTAPSRPRTAQKAGRSINPRVVANTDHRHLRPRARSGQGRGP
jgi:K+-sensing histidine kinase KdpD